MAALAAVSWERWGHATDDGRLKGRLDLEPYSGQTVAAVPPDFHAPGLLSHGESVGIGPAREGLAERSATRKQPAPVNRAGRVPAIKHRLIERLSSRGSAERVVGEWTEWFLANPGSVRPGRQVQRRENSPARSSHFQRRLRQLGF